jgi:hypothetical protein
MATPTVRCKINLRDTARDAPQAAEADRINAMASRRRM